MDQLAIDTAIELQLEYGLAVRHASAPAFLALKWAAFDDRGRGDPFASHDLDDIIAVIASRPHIVEEMRTAPAAIREFVRERANRLIGDRDFDDLLATDLSRAYDPKVAIQMTQARIQALAAS